MYVLKIYTCVLRQKPTTYKRINKSAQNLRISFIHQIHSLQVGILQKIFVRHHPYQIFS
mgnify:CR=1 FL=1|jgi:hypothetical protein